MSHVISAIGMSTFRNKSGVVPLDQTVAQMHRAPGVRGDVALVRDQNDGVAALIQIFEQRHDFFAGFGIEVAGRFVGQNDRRIVHQRARDRDALTLTAGQFVRLVMNAIAQANIVQRLRRAFLARFGIDAGVNQRQLDIAQGLSISGEG